MVFARLFDVPAWVWDVLLVVFVVIPLVVLWVATLTHIARRPDMARLSRLAWFGVVFLFPLAGTLVYLVRQPVVRVIERNPLAALGQTSDTVVALSAALDHFATTASLAQSSLIQGAALVGDMTEVLARADATLGFTVPFTRIRPLGPAHTEVQALGGKARALGRSLERIADALGTNAADLRAIAGDVATLAGTLGLAPRPPGRWPAGDAAALVPATSEPTIVVPDGALGVVSNDAAVLTRQPGPAPHP
jgi:hypothetical protein